MVQTSWRVDQTPTEKRNMSIAVRLHTEVGSKQAGDGVGVSSSDEKSGTRLVSRRGR